MGINNVDQIVDKYAGKYNLALMNAKAQAAEKDCGIMTVGHDEIIVCEWVPVGRILHAPTREAYLKFLTKHEPQG